MTMPSDPTIAYVRRSRSASRAAPGLAFARRVRAFLSKNRVSASRRLGISFPAVVALRRRRGEKALGDVLGDAAPIALRRIAVAAAARIEELDHVARLHVVAPLRMHFLAVDEVLAQCTGTPAADPL